MAVTLTPSLCGVLIVVWIIFTVMALLFVKHGDNRAAAECYGAAFIFGAIGGILASAIASNIAGGSLSVVNYLGMGFAGGVATFVLAAFLRGSL